MNRRLLNSIAILAITHLAVSFCHIAAFCNTAIAASLTGEEQLRKEIAIAEKIELVEGDHCLVGNIPINHEIGVGMLLRGRRVTVANVMVDEFSKNPGKYFSQLQPRAALFNEPSKRVKPSMGWTIVGIVVLGLVLLGGLSAAAAIRHGQDAGKWFFAGLCGNIFAPFTVSGKGDLIAALPEGHTKVPNTAQPESCPNCGYTNHPSAEQCGSCSAKLEPAYESEVKKTR